MLENIHIQNFRCFEDFKAEGFERINLIGGKNNSGKTCLLEALGTFSINYTFGDLIKLRGGKVEDFYNNKLGSEEKFLIKISGRGFQNVTQKYNGNILDNRSHWNMVCFFSKYDLPKYDSLEILKLIIDNNVDLKEKLINFLKIIDNRIQDIKLSDDSSEILLKKYNEDFQSIVLYGDAINKILKYFSPFLETKITGDIKNGVSCILIDEIENGIHYTAHYDFWKAIFKLSKELNVQIFATTHSLEMIQQFNKVAKEEGEAAYFEMSRDEINNSIKAIKHSTNILEEELDLNIGIRGEQQKDKISITPALLNSLNNAVKNAQDGLVANSIGVPFLKDGWIWETAADGTEKQIEKLEPLKVQ